MDVIEKQRIHILNDFDIVKGNYVLYWMHASQRVRYNHSLTYSCGLANRLNLPLLVFFGFTADYPEVNRRNMMFMLEGLSETSRELEKRNIKMIIWMIHPYEGAVNLSDVAAAIVTDFGYLKTQEEWIFRFAREVKKKLIAVESNVIVPVRSASSKEEYSAASFRPKMMKMINLYLNRVSDVMVKNSSLDFRVRGIDLSSPESVINEIKKDSCLISSDCVKGGTSNAVRLLNSFIRRKLDGYSKKRNDPSLDCSSYMSPYLHFGQISPVFIAQRILVTSSPGRDDYLEELIIRRELSFNFVYYNKDYDSTASLPSWALESLLKHESDPREYLYSRIELERADTHDVYWNAAQNELVTTGKIHNYMRMYWGKKIIQWTEGPDTAFEYMIYLNNKYSLDGNDPNSYAGIAWCLGKHDRPWKEIPIFGKVRYMNDKGLERKFVMDGYLKKYGIKT